MPKASKNRPLTAAIDTFRDIIIQTRNGFYPKYGNFVDFCFKEFEVSRVISILMEEGEPFWALRSILFSGLGTWILRPNSNDIQFIQSAVLIALTHKVIEVEEELDKLPGAVSTIRDFTMRLRPQTRALFELVYYPVGGIRSLLSAQNQSDFVSDQKAPGIRARAIVRQVAVFHHVVEESARRRRSSDLREAVLLKPSRNSAVETYKKLRYYTDPNTIDEIKSWATPPGSKNAMANYNKEFGPSTAFLYSAANLNVDDDKSLLTKLIDDPFGDAVMPDVQRRWLRMASFVQSHILAECHQPNPYREFSDIFDGIPPEPFACPIQDPRDQALINSEFRQAR